MIYQFFLQTCLSSIAACLPSCIVTFQETPTEGKFPCTVTTYDSVGTVGVCFLYHIRSLPLRFEFANQPVAGQQATDERPNAKAVAYSFLLGQSRAKRGPLQMTHSSFLLSVFLPSFLALGSLSPLPLDCLLPPSLGVEFFSRSPPPFPWPLF